jgi:hypothetical protein
MIIELSKELEDFYHDHDEDQNKKNLKLLIDEFEFEDNLSIGLIDLNFKPIFNKEERVEIIDIKKTLKRKDNTNLF